MTRRLWRSLTGVAALTVLAFAATWLITWSSRARVTEESRRAMQLTDDLDALSVKIRNLRRLSVGGGLPDNLVWKGETRAEIELRMQELVLGVAENHRIRLNGFGPGPAPATVRSAAVGYQFEGLGGWEDIVSMIDELEASNPAVSITELSIRASFAGAGPAEVPEVGFRIGVWGMAPSLGASR